MIAIGLWSHKRVDDIGDYFTAGGRMPWWLSGISHHMAGYSAVMFTGYAGISYQYGVTSYFTWAFPIAIGVAIGARLFAPRLNRMRARLHVSSPLEYLKDRYNRTTQQALAWSGVLLKIVDVGAKWAAIATLLSVFTGITLTQGIVITGAITAVYCTVGGLWADALTELGQFVIKWVAGLVGPIAIPFLLGLMRRFRRSGPTAALTSWALGLIAFYLLNYPVNDAISGGVKLQYQISVPVAVSLVLFIVIGFVKPEDTPERDAVIAAVDSDGPASASVPAPAGPGGDDGLLHPSGTAD